MSDQLNMANAENPVLVDVRRGVGVESIHRGAVAVVDATGRLVLGMGDIAGAVFPRSASKPLQALPLVETGAALKFANSDADIALACASHNGAVGHVEHVAAFLQNLGLGEDDLECGAQVPMGDGEGEAFLRNGQTASALYNNCSGKHAGFMATALALGADVPGYIRPDHPVQVRVMEAVREMTGADPVYQPCGTDGCGIPAPAFPLQALALGMARMADPKALSPDRATACRAVVAAMVAHPDLVAGEGRFDTVLMRAVSGIVSKAGAEGVQVAILPRLGLGVALKIDDGARRAAEVAMGAVLVRLGVVDAADAARAETLTVPIRNRAGDIVGDIRSRPGLWDQSSAS